MHQPAYAVEVVCMKGGGGTKKSRKEIRLNFDQKFLKPMEKHKEI